MKEKTTKKHSAAKKLIPATCMLLVSALTLVSSTYAWFTMSREVEVKNISMTATVPEDLQISLGALTSGELNKNTGILTGGVADTPAVATDWSNTADISAYYEMGKIIPASSTNGVNVYFTPDANGVGKTVDGEANYYAAALALAAQDDALHTGATPPANSNYMTTLHAATSDNKGANDTAITTSWIGNGYTPSSAWNKTNDDGYYVDIPVWIRSSAGSAVKLKVDGYVIPKSVTKAVSEADIQLYKAARIAILNGDTVTEDSTTGAVATTAGTAVQTNNVIPLYDAVDLANCTKDANNLITALAYNANKYSGSSVLDSVNYTGRGNGTAGNLYAVSALQNAANKADGTGTYIAGTYTQYQAYSNTRDASNNTDVIATIAAPAANAEYGAAKKLVLRVWLDGEDGECWNQNAGQDFSINLKFSKIEA